jgi:pyrroloquinoline quinone biosynthesis protein E
MKKQYMMTGEAKTKRLDKYHLIVGLTKSCDLRKCRHCYEEGLQKPDKTKGQMKPADVKKMLTQFAKIAHTESSENPIAHFKGGEPMIYPHFEEVALHAANLGLDVFITSNGLSLADKIAMLERINNASGGKMRITLSLNGSKPEVDALLRVDQEAYFASLRAAKALRGSGIPFDINYIVHQGNIDDLQSMVMLARELNAEQLNILQMIYAGNAGNGEITKANPETMLRILSDVFNTEPGRSMLPGSLPDVIAGLRSGRFARECVAGYRGLLYIKADGKVFSCPSTACSRFEMGNIHSSSIAQLMDSQVARRLRDLEIAPGCKGDALTGGKAAEKLRAVIKDKSGVLLEGPKSLCIQRNF